MLEFYFYQYSHIWHLLYFSFYGYLPPLSFTVWEQQHLIKEAILDYFESNEIFETKIEE
jgi:hypothetical protein